LGNREVIQQAASLFSNSLDAKTRWILNQQQAGGLLYLPHGKQDDIPWRNGEAMPATTIVRKPLYITALAS